MAAINKFHVIAWGCLSDNHGLQAGHELLVRGATSAFIIPQSLGLVSGLLVILINEEKDRLLSLPRSSLN